MAKKKSKLTVSSKRYEIDITQTDPAEIAEFSKSREGIESPFFAMADGSGVTIGRSLGDCEYKGTELPDWTQDRQLFVELNINFLVRVTCDREGTTYLEVHQEGHPTYYSFPFKGIKYKDLYQIVPDFKQRLSRFLIRFGMYQLFWALYDSKECGEKKRKETRAKITKNFEELFKNILHRENPIGTIKTDGLTITSYKRIDQGREPDTEAVLKEKKKQFLSDVFEALDQIRSEGGKQSQLDVGMIIFEDKYSEDIQSLVKNRCRKFGLKWKDVLNEYRQQLGKKTNAL